MSSIPICEIRDGSHGQGVFVTRDVKKGDILIEENTVVFGKHTADSPLACWEMTKKILLSQELISWTMSFLQNNQVFVENELKTNPLNRIMLKNFEKTLLLQKNINNASDKQKLILDVFGRVITNNFMSEDRKYQCLYRLASKINHSCRPNAGRAHKLNLKSDVNNSLEDKNNTSYSLMATKDIPKDTEVFIQYIEACDQYGNQVPLVEGYSVDTRRKALQHQYNFTCMCKECKEESLK